MSDFGKYLYDPQGRADDGAPLGWTQQRGRRGAAHVAAKGFAVTEKFQPTITPGASSRFYLGPDAVFQNLVVRNRTDKTMTARLGNQAVAADDTDLPISAGGSLALWVGEGETHCALDVPSGAVGDVIAFLGDGGVADSSSSAGGSSLISTQPLTSIAFGPINASGSTTLVPAEVGKTLQIHDILISFQSSAAVFSLLSGSTVLVPSISVEQGGGYDDRDAVSPLFTLGADEPLILLIPVAGTGATGIVQYRAA